MNSFDTNFFSLNEVFDYNHFSNEDQIEVKPLENVIEEESSTVIRALENLNQVENNFQEHQPNNEQDFND